MLAVSFIALVCFFACTPTHPDSEGLGALLAADTQAGSPPVDRNAGRTVCRLGARTMVLLRCSFRTLVFFWGRPRVGVWGTSESGQLLALIRTYRNAAALASSRLGKLPVRPVSGPGHRAPRSSCALRGQTDSI